MAELTNQQDRIKVLIEINNFIVRIRNTSMYPVLRYTKLAWRRKAQPLIDVLL